MTTQDVTFSNWYHFPKDGRRHCNADWVQVQALAVRAVEAIQDLPFHQRVFKGHWLVRGPDDVEFYVVLPRDVESLVNPATDQPYYLYQAPCVGLIDGKFILRAPSARETGALIRQHTSQDSPRVLELFSGIGGWRQALQAVFNQEIPVSSIEIDPIPARTLAKTTGRPSLSSQEWLTAPLLQDFVLNGDIKDPTWWASTLIHPFSQVCFSAPLVNGRLSQRIA